ncbi:MAG: hypothetical protein RLZZ621_462, partial [Gemmatimonadota bacterium]
PQKSPSHLLHAVLLQSLGFLQQLRDMFTERGFTPVVSGGPLRELRLPNARSFK